MTDKENSVWIPPSDWVAFPDVGKWIESRFSETPPAEWIQDIFDAVQQYDMLIPYPVRHRVQGLNETDMRFAPVNPNLVVDPPGLKLRARHLVLDVVVAEWDKAGFDSRTFTVAGRLNGNERSRHLIEVYWVDVQQRIQDRIKRRSLDQAKLAAGTPAPKATPEKGKGGRPPSPKSDDFWIEVAIFTGINGLEPKDRLRLQKELENWAVKASENPDDPIYSRETIRDKLRALYRKASAEN